MSVMKSDDWQSAFIKFAGTQLKTIAISLDTARSLPSNPAVEVRRNGYVLTNYKEV